MRRTAGQCVFVGVAVCLIWSAAQAEDYGYPYRDPYLATATSALLDAHRQIPLPRRWAVDVPGLAGRDDLPTLEGRGHLSVALYRQSHPAPLLFILAGIGSNAYFGLG